MLEDPGGIGHGVDSMNSAEGYKVDFTSQEISDWIVGESDCTSATFVD